MAPQLDSHIESGLQPKPCTWGIADSVRSRAALDLANSPHPTTGYTPAPHSVSG